MRDAQSGKLNEDGFGIEPADDKPHVRKTTSYHSSFTAKPVPENEKTVVSDAVNDRLDITKAKTTRSRAQSVALIGLCIAITAVCAWVSIPLGPVPFTLQMFAVTFFICILTPSESIATVFGYVLLGAIGVPVFSGMRGGLGVLLGPTGGFLLGYLLGVTVASFFLYAIKSAYSSRAKLKAEKVRPEEWAKLNIWQRMSRNLALCGFDIVAGFIFVLVSYVTGWAQYMLITDVGPTAAFVTCIAPFIVGDVVKVVLAALCAQSVKIAIQR